jgi:peptide/nickel transport system permease protein
MIALTALLFFSLTALLGSPAAMMLGQDASAEAIAAINARYGFDRPLYVQYLDWITSAMRGDFGRSHTTQQTVASAIMPCIGVTLELAFCAIVLAAGAAVITNTLPSGRRVLGPVVVGANLIGITVPNFMLGISLIFIFSVALGWLPSTGWAPWSAGGLTHLKHMMLPVLTLSAYYFGVFSIVYRAEYRDVEKRLFIKAARAKGISRSRVAFHHALPNAILPVITFVGLSMGQLTGGAVVTETVFSMPGIGRLLVASIASHDFPVMLAIAMMIVVGVVFMNLLADIAYTVVNPQIRLE